MPVWKWEGIQIYLSRKRFMSVYKWEGGRDSNIPVWKEVNACLEMGMGKGFKYTCLDRGSCLFGNGKGFKYTCLERGSCLSGIWVVIFANNNNKSTLLIMRKSM